MWNVNTETNIPFGVIACNNLDSDLVHDLWYGAQAEDLTYQQAYADAKRSAELEFNDLLEEAYIMAAETGADRELGYDSSDYFDKFCERKGVSSDLDTYVEDALESFSDRFQCDEPQVRGTYEGVTYLIDWLGGAPLLWVLHSPHIVQVNSACSPCVPHAGDLDSGISVDGGGYTCYGIPEDWYANHTQPNLI